MSDRPQTADDVKAFAEENNIRFVRLWFTAIEESDMIAVPDPTTFNVLPWRPEDGAGVARMFADVQTPERRPYEGDPRHVLRRAEERARDMGFDAFNVGPELEYY